MMTDTNGKAPKITWYVWAGGQRSRHEATMRGSWGWDVECSCGWGSHTGGAIKARVEEARADHMYFEHGIATGIWARIYGPGPVEPGPVAEEEGLLLERAGRRVDPAGWSAARGDDAPAGYGDPERGDEPGPDDLADDVTEASSPAGSARKAPTDCPACGYPVASYHHCAGATIDRRNV
jgi:hypothetical protein